MITDKLEEICAALCECKEDAEKAEGGNVSASRRARKALMEVTKSIKDLRTMILENSKKEQQMPRRKKQTRELTLSESLKISSEANPGFSA